MTTKFTRDETVKAFHGDFDARMRKLLTKSDYDSYLQSLNLPPLRAARLNPLKPVKRDLIIAETGGFPLLSPTAKPGLMPLHAAGAYYVQEPAAAEVAKLLAPLLPDCAAVLDMCAAPGGKATAAASARPDCNFLCNETVFSRAKILLSNVERLGLRNCTVSSLRPEEISQKGANIFDAVIADVPCSGEGMLRKTEFNSGDLSDESVAACAARAASILDECDKCLKCGGILAFSTCTFNLAENEEQVKRLIREKGYEPIEPTLRPERSRRGFDLPQAVRFFPQDGGGEGHFACLLRKTRENETYRKVKNKDAKLSGNKKIAEALKQAANFTSENFNRDRIIILGEGCEYLPCDYPFGAFPALRRGMRIADFAGDRPIFHHHFATAANAALTISSPDYAPDSPQIGVYLSGEEFECDEKDGFRILKVASITLGLIKISNGTAKNRYPKGLRRL